LSTTKFHFSLSFTFLYKICIHTWWHEKFVLKIHSLSSFTYTHTFSYSHLLICTLIFIFIFLYLYKFRPRWTLQLLSRLLYDRYLLKILKYVYLKIRKHIIIFWSIKQSQIKNMTTWKCYVSLSSTSLMLKLCINEVIWKLIRYRF
jgi:hypothetical protein